jgi:lipid II isoglutaminyl synthase (glutamine-hydrolysing)
LPQNGRLLVLGGAAAGTNDIGWLSCRTMTALRLAGESQVSGAKIRVILGDTISISAHRKVRPGGARHLRGARRARHAGRLSAAASGRRALAITAGKAARGTVRRLGRGNGTAIPGVTALAIDQGMLGGLAAEIRRGAVLVTGTNGKGTTCRMLAGMMRAAGLHPILNHEGSNQPTGLVTTLLAHASPLGHLPADDQAIGLFEVDEGSLPEILSQVKPGALVFTNIFRDQLDRYLELDYLTRRWEQALRALPADTTLVLNADDPRLAYLASELKNPRVYYGLQDVAQGRGVDHTSDFPRCPRCAGELAYGCVFYAHLGHWECLHCGLARPAPQVRVAKIDLIGPTSSRLQLTTPAGEAVLEIPAPGLYSAYNTAAAAAAAAACQLPAGALSAVEEATTGFFRMERVTIDGREVHLALAKNPNGYTEVLRALLGDGQPKHMLLGLNDRASNQQPDVSWIWDVDFESLRGLVPAAVLSGNRATDLAVRLKYAGWLGPEGSTADGSTGVTDIVVEPDPLRALRLALDAAPPGQPVWVVSTYLVLWQLRSWLRRQGYVGALWER